MKILMISLCVVSTLTNASDSEFALKRSRTPLSLGHHRDGSTPSAVAYADEKFNEIRRVESSSFVATTESVYDIAREECERRISGSPNHDLIRKHLYDILQSDQQSPDFNAQRSSRVAHVDSDYISSVVSRAFKFAIKDMNEELERKRKESDAQFTRCQSFTMAVISAVVSGGVAIAAAFGSKAC